MKASQVLRHLLHGGFGIALAHQLEEATARGERERVVAGPSWLQWLNQSQPAPPSSLPSFQRLSLRVRWTKFPPRNAGSLLQVN